MLTAFLQAGAAHEAGGESAAFPPFDPTLFPSQLFWFVLTFGALYLIMSRMALPKVGAVLARREGTLKADRDGAASSTAAAEDAKAAMEKAIAKARADARALVEDMRSKTQAELAREQEAADTRLNARIGEAEAKINAAREKSLAEVGALASALAAEIAEKLAPASTTAAAPEPRRMVEGESR